MVAKGIKEHVVRPLVERLASMGAVALIAVGADGELAHQVATGVLAAGLIIFELVAVHLAKRGAK